MDELRSTIDAYNAGKKDLALAIVNSNKGFQLMMETRRVIDAMQAEEGRLLMERQTSAERFALLLEVVVVVASILICMIGYLVARLTRTSVSALAVARDELLASNTQLREQIGHRELAETQLRQAQKMEAVGQLTEGIAHDFNNMLGVVMAAIELASRRISKSDFAVQRFLDAATEATRRAATLTQRLLAFARQQPLAPRLLDVNKMIGNMSDLLCSTLGEHIKIEFVAAAGLWSVNADAQQLENAILNIAINARDAVPPGGKLTIETANSYLDDAYCRQNPEIDPGQFVRIAVTDTGGGMTPDVISRF